MNKSFSIYLDFVRFFAAALVFIFHARDIMDLHLGISNFGHEAVIIFFILSGYVIAHVSAGKEKTLKDYTVSRLARIYSVALPAIVLTWILDRAGFAICPAAYEAGKQAWDHAAVRAGSATFFLGEIWILSIQLFSNVPYWSLNYEVWYYVGFALLMYVGGGRGRLLFLLLCLFTGPKILLLAPLWWAGVYIRRSKRLNALSPRAGLGLVALSVAGVFVYIFFGLGVRGMESHEFLLRHGLPLKLAYSKQFLTDYFLGLAVAAHFVGMRALCASRPALFDAVEKPVRAVAASTFTLYLLHQPLLLFFHALLYRESLTAGRFWLIQLCALVAVFVAAAVIERRKHFWKKVFAALYDVVAARLGGLFGYAR